MNLRPPRFKRTATIFPSTTLVRSVNEGPGKGRLGIFVIPDLIRDPFEPTGGTGSRIKSGMTRVFGSAPARESISAVVDRSIKVRRLAAVAARGAMHLPRRLGIAAADFELAVHPPNLGRRAAARAGAADATGRASGWERVGQYV